MSSWLVSRLLIVGASITAVPAVGSAQSAFVFQTTFDCADWHQSMGLSDSAVCAAGDGIGGAGGWTTSNGSEDQITASANYPGGGGGRGFRHFRGDGWNNNGGGLTISLPAPAAEVWVRFYMRYSQAFAWSAGEPQYIKDHYWHTGAGDSLIFGIYGSTSDGEHSWGVYKNKSYGSEISWGDTQGGATGSGQWHCYEYHLAQNGPNGVFELWVDGVQYASSTGDFGGSPLEYFLLGSNQNAVVGAGASDYYTDYDDFAISTTGYIGPIGGPTNPAPAAPVNLRVQ